MKAPVRSHGFEKPSDLEEELVQLDEERADPELNTTTRASAPNARIAADAATSVQQQIDELREDLDALRQQVDRLNNGNVGSKRRDGELSSWMPMVRSIAVTSLAGRVFASSPIMAILVAAVPFALGLSAGSK